MSTKARIAELTSAAVPTLIALLVAPAVAYAQEPGKVGVTMGYPSSVGVIWQVAARVALRPEIALSRSTGDSASNDASGATPLSTIDSTGVGVGLSALFYLHRWEGLRTYVSPRFSYVRTSASSSTTAGMSTAESTASSYLTSGSFGVQCSLGRHFGVFGEIGLGFTASRTALTSTLTLGVTAAVIGAAPSRTEIVQSSTHAHTLATRSGAGVIFFF